MPKVNTYDTPQVREAPNRVPLQRMDSRGAFGENLGRGLADAGSAGAAIALKQRAEDDAAVTKERVAAYRDFSRSRMYGDDDAFYGRMGRDAYDSRDTMRKELDDKKKEIAKGLTGRQQKLFNQAVQGYVDRDYDGIAKHSAKGRRQWMDEQDAYTITSAQEDGALYWNDNGEYATQIRKSLANLANRNGWTPERRQVEEEKYLSAMHVSAIDNALQADPERAAEYFEANKDDILPSLHDNIRAKIEQRNDDIWVQGQADIINAMGGNLGERRAEAEKIEDPDRRKAVMSQVEHDWRMDKQAEQEVQIGIVDEARKRPADMSLNQWRAANPDKWDVLTANQQAALRKPVVANSDLDVYYTMRGMIAEGRMEDAREYLSRNSDKLTPTDAKGFIDDILPTAGTQTMKPIMSDLSAFNRTVDSVLGKRPTKDGTDRRDYDRKYTIMMGIYEDMMGQWRADNPNTKYVPQEVRQNILDQFEIEKTRERDWWFDTEVSMDDIPVDDMRQIREVLRSQGYPVTPDNIIRVYLSQN